VVGCLWLKNLISGRLKTFPKRKNPALFFKAEGPFRSFFYFLLTLLLIGVRGLDFLLIPPSRHLVLEEFACHLVHQQHMQI
jgi:hypothetical protein